VAKSGWIDDARRHNSFGLIVSLIMLTELGEAFDYTGADLARWCKLQASTTLRSCPSPVPQVPASHK